MRHPTLICFVLPLLVGLGCGGESSEDLFNGGGQSSRGGASFGGASSQAGGPQGGALASGGTESANGGVAGALANGGSDSASGGNEQGGALSSGGVDSGMGGSSASLGGSSSSLGGSSSGGQAAGGNDTTMGGASSGGATSSSGGATGSGGAASGGSSVGGAGCVELRNGLAKLQDEAQACSPNGNMDQCTGSVSSECNCPVPVNSQNSAATRAYTAALEQYKKRCAVACAAVLCAPAIGARCQGQGNGPQSSGQCVASNLSSTN